MGLAALGELSVIIRIPLEAVNHNTHLLDAIAETGASAISTAPPHGALPGVDGTVVSGRLYGPGMFPQALANVKKLSGTGIPIIGAGGVYSQRDVDALLDTGAMAVQLDSILWQGNLPANYNG